LDPCSPGMMDPCARVLNACWVSIAPAQKISLPCSGIETHARSRHGPWSMAGGQLSHDFRVGAGEQSVATQMFRLTFQHLAKTDPQRLCSCRMQFHVSQAGRVYMGTCRCQCSCPCVNVRTSCLPLATSNTQLVACRPKVAYMQPSQVGPHWWLSLCLLHAADQVDPPLANGVLAETLDNLNAEPHTLNLFVRAMRAHWTALCANAM
jgi:hypothetical protein